MELGTMGEHVDMMTSVNFDISQVLPTHVEVAASEDPHVVDDSILKFTFRDVFPLLEFQFRQNEMEFFEYYITKRYKPSENRIKAINAYTIKDLRCFLEIIGDTVDQKRNKEWKSLAFFINIHMKEEKNLIAEILLHINIINMSMIFNHEEIQYQRDDKFNWIFHENHFFDFKKQKIKNNVKIYHNIPKIVKRFQCPLQAKISK
ncbi:hypothetical protein V1477_017866 [Vespula maculifrons]|uniref:Uncharacterized protein n=1 Tax=Vespula maculifrons TaxID=7453 RepID=A0ABD2B0G8_VESMC